MSYECENCGASFDTLSRLRLHECPPEPANETPAASPPLDDSDPEPATVENDYPTLVGGLPSLIEDAREGDLSALYRSMAEYETALKEARTTDESGSTGAHHEILFAYYEPLAEGLDRAAHANGWDVLVEFVTAYAPREQERLPEVAHVIANAVGRSLVRARLSDEIASIPPDALVYLGAIPEYVDEFAVAYEEAFTYGWGIAHPEHSVSDQLRALAETEHKWVRITLTTAFHADQHAAVDTLERLVTDDSLTGTIQQITYDTGVTRYYFGAVAGLTQDVIGPHVPIYWEFEDEVDYAFELDPAVEQRIRDLAHETGVTDDLPDDWALHDLDPSPLSELTRMLGESSGEDP